MASNEELMQAVADGDMDAFGEIVRRHQTSAWNAAWRLLGDAAEAEDAAQDAFMKILQAAPRYRPTATFRTYLYRVVTRLCLDRLEKKRPQYAGGLPTAEAGSLAPPELLVEREAKAAVHRALDALPARQRTAIVLKHFEGLSYQQIAGAMDTSPKAVERLLARAREELHRRLSELREE
jgi:RNA polymerase sigma-70 factor (ECF subfamily)